MIKVPTPQASMDSGVLSCQGALKIEPRGFPLDPRWDAAGICSNKGLADTLVLPPRFRMELQKLGYQDLYQKRRRSPSEDVAVLQLGRAFILNPLVGLWSCLHDTARLDTNLLSEEESPKMLWMGPSRNLCIVENTSARPHAIGYFRGRDIPLSWSNRGYKLGTEDLVHAMGCAWDTIRPSWSDSSVSSTFTRAWHRAFSGKHSWKTKYAGITGAARPTEIKPPSVFCARAIRLIEAASAEEWCTGDLDQLEELVAAMEETLSRFLPSTTRPGERNRPKPSRDWSDPERAEGPRLLGVLGELRRIIADLEPHRARHGTQGTYVVPKGVFRAYAAALRGGACRLPIPLPMWSTNASVGTNLSIMHQELGNTCWGRGLRRTLPYETLEDRMGIASSIFVAGHWDPSASSSVVMAPKLYGNILQRLIRTSAAWDTGHMSNLIRHTPVFVVYRGVPYWSAHLMHKHGDHHALGPQIRGTDLDYPRWGKAIPHTGLLQRYMDAEGAAKRASEIAHTSVELGPDYNESSHLARDLYRPTRGRTNDTWNALYDDLSRRCKLEGKSREAWSRAYSEGYITPRARLLRRTEPISPRLLLGGSYLYCPSHGGAMAVEHFPQETGIPGRVCKGCRERKSYLSLIQGKCWHCGERYRGSAEQAEQSLCFQCRMMGRGIRRCCSCSTQLGGVRRPVLMYKTPRLRPQSSHSANARWYCHLCATRIQTGPRCGCIAPEGCSAGGCSQCQLRSSVIALFRNTLERPLPIEQHALVVVGRQGELISTIDPSIPEDLVRYEPETWCVLNPEERARQEELQPYPDEFPDPPPH